MARPHTRVPFVAGNWKMNSSIYSIATFCATLSEPLQALLLDTEAGQSDVQIAIAPPFPYIQALVDQLKKTGLKRHIEMAAQNASSHQEGAFTGETSARMLRDLGVDWVILGHSERRTLFHESDELIGEKVKTALEAGLRVILCVGEPLHVRASETGDQAALAHIQAQLDKLLPYFPPIFLKDQDREAPWPGSPLVVAYEPIWAIGTGRVATPLQAEAMHCFIRQWLEGHFVLQIASDTRVIYGGSVNAANSVSLMEQPHIDGLLVGGASLNPLEIVQIIENAKKRPLAS